MVNASLAYDIVERLEEANRTELLKTLEDGVTPSDKRRGKFHEVYEPSFYIKLCRTYKFVKQKPDYMHANPVSKKWKLVNDFTDYIHSSAAFYEKGIPGVYEILHVTDWINDTWVSFYETRYNDSIKYEAT